MIGVDNVLGIDMFGLDAPEIIQSLALTLRAGATKRDFDRTAALHSTVEEEFVLDARACSTIWLSRLMNALPRIGGAHCIDNGCIKALESA